RAARLRAVRAGLLQADSRTAIRREGSGGLLAGFDGFLDDPWWGWLRVRRARRGTLLCRGQGVPWWRWPRSLGRSNRVARVLQHAGFPHHRAYRRRGCGGRIAWLARWDIYRTRSLRCRGAWLRA